MSEPDPTPSTSRELVLPVQGMHCAGCAGSVERALCELPGVQTAAVTLADESALVRYEPSAVHGSQLRAAIEKAGYTVPSTSDVAGEAVAAAEQAQEAELADKTLRMRVGIGLSLAVMALGMGTKFGVPDFPGRLWLLAALTAPVQFWVGADYWRGAWYAARNRTTNMDTLVVMGSSVAFFYSVTVLALGLEPARFPVYFESAAMIVTLIAVGKLIEARAKAQAGASIRSLLALQSPTARIVRGEQVVEVSADDLEVGDEVVVRQGDRFPVDGSVCEGEGWVDESLLTGESVPREKAVGDAVHAGSFNGGPPLHVRATRVGAHTGLAAIVRLVREAQASRAPIQATADRVAAYFVPAVITTAVLTGVTWGFYGAAVYFPEIHPIGSSLMFTAAVLLISCPCAMGLATPTAIMAGTGVGADMGLLIKSASALEAAGQLTTAVLDKTGTVTEGRPALIDVVVDPDGRDDADSMLALIASAEQNASHPLAEALVEAAEQRGLALHEPSDIEPVTGKGLLAQVAGRHVALGNHALMGDQGVDVSAWRARAEAMQDAGKTALFVALDGVATGLVSLADPPKATSAAAIEELRELGLKVKLLTGDAEATALHVANAVGIPAGNVIAGVLPGDKAAEVARLQSAGESVAMVGDGINDAPALARADVGIAVGSGTDVAIESADLVLVGNDLRHVARAIRLSQRTLRTIRQNLFWAFAYNVAAIPLAAGAFVPLLGPTYRLQPPVAALAMTLSSVFVVGNSLRLRRLRPNHEDRASPPQPHGPSSGEEGRGARLIQAGHSPPRKSEQ